MYLSKYLIPAGMETYRTQTPERRSYWYVVVRTLYRQGTGARLLLVSPRLVPLSVWNALSLF